MKVKMMAAGVATPVRPTKTMLVLYFICLTVGPFLVEGKVLSPPTFNLAQGRNITATATCGVGVVNPERYCRLTGTSSSSSNPKNPTIIQGQACDYCSPLVPSQDHRPEYAIDGTERWWQSPPLSRSGKETERVNLTVSLGQEFHVAYVFIRMANSPRPAVWALERSNDFGKTFHPWQYFASTPNDCDYHFGVKANQPLEADDQILCITEFSKVVPLSNGEIVVSMVNGRPNANNFSYADSLQKWTKATDVRLRLIKTKTLLGHLMAIARQDPTVTRRYYYSIKDISIGGRCVCNGHANTCNTPDFEANRLLCDCQHNTCGAQCDSCCPGFTQKPWRRALIDQPFQCEACECYGHATECIFNEEINRNSLSVDIYGNYEGGGVCQNCSDNTMGINCEQCKPTFYRPYGVLRNATDACRPCQCDLSVSTGECEEGSGRCLCRPEFAGVNCDSCSFGYFDYPDCIPCKCDVNGTENALCMVQTGSCPCKENFDGVKCDQCARGYYNFPECIPCECISMGSLNMACDAESGQCECRTNYGGHMCGECAAGYYNYPNCDYCDCDTAGTEPVICDNSTSECLCRQEFDGERCDKCYPGYFAFPNCYECQCEMAGSLTSVCGDDGQCSCMSNFGGLNCDRCAPGYYNYPTCSTCDCDLYGSLSRSCNKSTGQCECRDNFVGLRCDKCGENFYNYPMCEVCNCNPNGAKEIPGYPLGGCGIVNTGTLCECKERVMGRICDDCKPGYWNLDRNNRQGCQECQCYGPGTLTGLNHCDVITGQCMCKPEVKGRACNRCLDGFYNLQDNNLFGCVDCNCDPGGSQSLACDQITGQCICKPRVTGKRCEKPLSGHFHPTLHQYKFEIEDGRTSEGTRIRYGYDERIFPNFSWRGYAILTSFQPEVLLDVDIRIPSLYRLIYRYVNRQSSSLKGTITLTPESPSQSVQNGGVEFLPSIDPKFVYASNLQSRQLEFVLDPGRWTISTNVPDNIFLDYFVLLPEPYYEATQVQERVTRPCRSPTDPGPCLEFGYPDLSSLPSVRGSLGYVIEGNERHPVVTLPDEESIKLGTTDLVVLNANQSSIMIDLTVPDPGHYVIILSYFNLKNNSHELDIEVSTPSGLEPAVVKLSSCKLTTLCRQVLKTPDGEEAVFNISTGQATIHINGKPGVDVLIDAVYANPIGLWNSDYIMPRIICIKVNGICVPSTYGDTLQEFRIDFEHSPNDILISTHPPPGILDPSVGLIYLNDTLTTGVPIELYKKINKPGDYIVLVHYYMPNEVGLKMPVTVYFDGKFSKGTFEPQYCPNSVGCRRSILFEESGGSTIRLTDQDIRVVFNHSYGGEIWLDYLLIVPLSKYNVDYLELLPIDKSKDFLDMCVDDGFNLILEDEFCREGAFTLTTNFNNGVLDCNCLAEGSLSFTCESFGGQCDCRENIIGRTCTVCRPGYYGFPNCRRCDCPYGLCEENTGACICPPKVEGDRCDVCEDDAFGYDALIGCQACNCNSDGVETMNCNQTTGQCNCADNIGGRQCDTCLPGFHSFPYCYDCGCEANGTVDEICDQTSNKCLCKENVDGLHCNKCKEGTFNLDADNPKGCTQCFCLGQTNRCDSANLHWDKISVMTGWASTYPESDEIQESGDTIRISFINKTFSDSLYWMAPAAYRGKQTLSYGGKLSFSVLFTLPRNASSERLTEPDLIMTGNEMTISHFHHEQPEPSTNFLMEIPLHEDQFVHVPTNAAVKREQFMMLLNKIDALLIRGSYYKVVGEMRLSNVEMETASKDGAGALADTIEMCECPANYQGLSCEECSPGHYRSLSIPFLGICSKCNCNGHTEECDVNTGECFNCSDNTTGPHCEKCLVGYYGDPTTGGCQICSCPLPVASNNFATTCSVSEDGLTTSCDCRPGYSGSECRSCSPGYYGNPLTLGEFCQPCQCNDNIDTTDPESCDVFSGVCLKCDYYTSGVNCDMCEDWFWGDAIVRKDCEACSCDRCGSESCDKIVGTCQCKPNVMGPDCDKCMPNTWNFNRCAGCEDCNCGEGSQSQQCDLDTGMCTCLPGVEGEKCDKCKPGHWNYGANGCQECDCLIDGATGCDPETGSCLCLPGVTGSQCDECLPRWVLVPTKGCQECDYCIHLLMDDLDILEANVSAISNSLAEVKVGIGAFKTLARYNETVDDLTPQVQALGALDNNTFMDMIVPLKDSLEQLEQDCKANHTESESLLYRANQLPSEVSNFLQEASEAKNMTEELDKIAVETLAFIDGVRMQIIDTSNTRNLNYLIEEGESITKDIQARDFSVQNDSARNELNETLADIDVVKPLGMQSRENLNQTMLLQEELDDRILRLKDSDNSSNYAMSDAKLAMNTIKKLRSWEIKSLNEKIKLHNDIHQEADEDITKGNDLLTKADMIYEDGQEAINDIGRESSKMDTALSELMYRVENISMRLDNLNDLTNQSLIHALQLKETAGELDEMYESTRNISENAVMAGQAYDNILNAIEEAMNSSQEALVDAEVAHNESLGIGTNVSQSVEASTNLLDEVNTVKDSTLSDLGGRLAGEGDRILAAANRQRDDIIPKFESISANMEKLKADSGSTATQSNKMMQATKTAEEQVIEALDKSQPIRDAKKSNQAKLDYVKEGTPSINDGIREINDNAKAVTMSLPEVQNMMETHKNKTDELDEMRRLLELNVASLKEKIARARHEANRIRVGLKYQGNSSVTLRTPDKLENTGSFSTLSLFIKSTQLDALLFFVGNSQNTDTNMERRKRSLHEADGNVKLLSRSARQAEFQGDYMALEMRSGYIVFSYNLGSGPARVSSKRLVNDGKWHQIIAQRIGKTGTLTIKSEEKEDDVQKGTSRGAFAVLELDPASTLFLAGGVPLNVNIPSEISPAYFIGSMEDVKFDGNPVGLWNFREGENNVQGEYHRDVLQELMPKGTRFSGSGYAVLSKRDLNIRGDKTRASLFFKTYAEEGLLFYMGGKDFMSLEIRQGKVTLQYDLGGGPAVIESDQAYNDGDWHKVLIYRNKKTGILSVDTNEQRGESKGNLKTLESNNDVYFGGINSALIPTGNIVTTGFDGCMRDINFGPLSVDVFENKRAKGIIKGCAPKIIHVLTFPSSMSYISLPPVDSGSAFDLTFKFKTIESDALLVFTTDMSQSNMFSVTLSKGQIRIVEELGSSELPLTSRINTYNNGEWHYVSIMKMGQKLTMSIDDLEVVETQSKLGDLILDTAIYFGGLPSDLDVKSSSIFPIPGLKGCMGDITINKKFQNLVQVKDSKGVSLTDCAITKQVKPTVDPKLEPDQCALPPVSSDTEDTDADAEVEGVRFGSMEGSRREFSALPISITTKSFDITLSFKTTAKNGVIFYTTGNGNTDFLTIYLHNGVVFFAFNPGSGAAVISSFEPYNDGQWHSIKARRSSNRGILTMDGIKVGAERSKGITRTLNVIAPYFLGGLSKEFYQRSAKHLGVSRIGFVGCLKDFRLKNRKLVKVAEEVGLKPCSNREEGGAFIGVDGGHIELYDRFKVGKKFEVSMEIRPRSQNGILMAVHDEAKEVGKKADFLVIQLVDGELIFSTDNGAGIITASFKPPKRNSLCDGRWHTIKAVKDGSVLELMVDDSKSEPVVGKGKVSSADTAHPLFLGGAPDTDKRGIDFKDHFVGCIRNVEVNGVTEFLPDAEPTGDVRLGTCPTPPAADSS